MSRNTSPELSEPPSSSPPLPVQSLPKSLKPKKPPPVTPKRFNRFFNPRSSSSTSSRSARALKELTSSATNRANPPKDQHDSLSDSPRKRIKYSSPDHDRYEHSDIPISSSPPIVSSPCQSYQYRTRQDQDHQYPKPISRSKLSFGRKQFRFDPYYVDFVSTPQDTHVFNRPHLPFATVACNTNPLVAVGTERGEIHLLDSEIGSKPDFSQSFLKFAPHENAIMDLAFNSDDSWLASASGDQSAKITDMRTQTPIYVLAEHTSSLKQVVFQPGNESIVATCSRDSVVALWDLRCASTGPVIRNKQPIDPPDQRSSVLLHEIQPKPKYATIYKSISNWHHNLPQGHISPVSTPSSSTEAVTREARQPMSESNQTRPKASITSIVFLPQSPHHIVTSSDASSCLRIWDIRSRLLSTRKRFATPVQLPVATSAPDPYYSTTRRRQYGTTCLVLSTDAARLYAVSRDNCVQVYSTQHLILGQAYDQPKSAREKTQTGLQGAPPLYSLSHPALRTGSFYIRASVRRTSPLSHWPEMLAVGSSDNSVVLFPTDVHPKYSSLQPDIRGAALRFGHSKEVTGLAWTSDGELVSCGDDYVARVWRENRLKAAELRSCGPSATDEMGRSIRAGCGWYTGDCSSTNCIDNGSGCNACRKWDEDEA